ncbi:hypothetical protein FWH30_00920 [Microgenomates group bacterium]|nr:hypothetical protein [Microgenomates group bacterium]
MCNQIHTTEAEIVAAIVSDANDVIMRALANLFEIKVSREAAGYEGENAQQTYEKTLCAFHNISLEMLGLTRDIIDSLTDPCDSCDVHPNHVCECDYCGEQIPVYTYIDTAELYCPCCNKAVTYESDPIDDIHGTNLMGYSDELHGPSNK